MLKWKLAILSQVPETFPPDNYSDLLPDISETDPSVEGDWEIHNWREKKDFIESPQVLQAVFGINPAGMNDCRWWRRKTRLLIFQFADLVNDELAPVVQHFNRFEEKRHRLESQSVDSPANSRSPLFIETLPFDDSVQLPAHLGQTVCYPASAEVVSKWYYWRSREIEAKTGLVEHATALIEIAINQGVPGLIDYYRTLVELYTIVYQCGKELTLPDYEALPEFDRLTLLLEDANPTTICSYLTVRIQNLLFDRPIHPSNLT